MNNQEMFNIVWERAKDKNRCMAEDETCFFRGKNGSKCFIGACIRVILL